MLERGVYLAPSQFEAAFVSLAHSEADLDAAGRAPPPEALRRRRVSAELSLTLARGQVIWFTSIPNPSGGQLDCR